MSYVPPHKRTGEARRSPESPSGKALVAPYPLIRTAAGYNSKFEIVSSGKNGDRLQFQVFQGDSYAHLAHSKQYIVAAVETGDPGESHGGLVDSVGMESLVSDVLASLSAASRYLEDPEESGVLRSKIKLVMRFGKVVFRPDGDRPPEIVSRSEIMDSRTRRTFHTAISQQIFDGLERVALQQEAMQITATERFVFRVQDIKRPKHLIKCACERSQEDPHSIVPIKVKSQALRHLVRDYLCVGKPTDIRIAMYSESLLSGDPEDLRAHCEALAAAARIDESVKGGLRWPLGRDSVANRFRVQESQYRKVTKFRGTETEWKFLTVNRSDGPGTVCELAIHAIDWKGNENASLRNLVRCAEACI